MQDRTLRALEAVIERGLATFVEVGAALLEIRDGRLYRDAGYGDFDAYCRERWGWSRQRSHQLIEAAAVVRGLSTTVDSPIPANEAQARELARIADPDRRAEVWREVAADRGIAHVTAQRIREVTERRQGITREPVEDEAPTPWERANADPGLKWLEGMRELYRIFVSAEHAGGFALLASKWGDENRRRYVAEIRRIKAVLDGWEETLEASLGTGT